MIRYCPKCQKDETRNECKYGPRYWDMFSVPSPLSSNQMKFDIAQVHPANEGYDHEYSMARSELSTIISAAKRLKKKMKRGEGEIEAWVQSKITKAADYIDSAADYVESGEMKESNQLTENPLIGLGIRTGLAAGTALAGKMVYDKAKTVAGKIDQRNKKQQQQIDQILGKQVKEQLQTTDSPSDKKSFDIAVKKIMNRKDKMSPRQRIVALQQAGKLQGVDEGKTFGQFMSEAKKSEMKCNSPKSDPVGDSLTGKSHVVKACEGGKEKLIRFGQRGVKGSPKKKGESKEYASRRHRFQTRHAKNIAKGKMSAAYWANKVKW